MATPTEDAHRPPHDVARSAAVLATLGAALALGLYGLWQLTHERIERNRQAWIEQPLTALLAPMKYDNDVLADVITVVSPDVLGADAPASIYRARLAGEPVAAVIRTIAPDGYRGPIELLIAVDYEGVLLGVDVLRHNETPGLGDVFENREAGWLEAFRGLSLSTPPAGRWTVRKEGGAFDAFTGATITPRAIVKAVRRALEYYRAYRDRIFEADAAGEP